MVEVQKAGQFATTTADIQDERIFRQEMRHEVGPSFADGKKSVHFTDTGCLAQNRVWDRQGKRLCRPSGLVIEWNRHLGSLLPKYRTVGPKSSSEPSPQEWTS